MDKLFGIPINSIMVALLALLGLALAVVLVVAVRHPLLARMGLRNLLRRRAQTTLIVVGLMLSTLIISAAFSTGDTVGYSVTNSVYQSLQQVDFVLGFDSNGQPASRDQAVLSDDFYRQVQERFGPGKDADIDGITPLVRETLPAVNPARRLSEPRAELVGVDPVSVDSFEGLRDLNGKTLSAKPLTQPAPCPPDRPGPCYPAFVSSDLVKQIEVKQGDWVDVYVQGKPATFQVLDIVRDTGVSGSGFGSNSGGLVANIGTVRDLVKQPGLSAIALSSTGGVRDTADVNKRVKDKIDAFIKEHPEAHASIAFSKPQLVGIAEIAGTLFVTFFLVFGLFSIAAGIMLIFLIFIMLAAERRSELGMARAIGMKRLHVTEVFLAEGMAYNLGSAAVGALLGLAVALLLVTVLGKIAGNFGLDIAFHFNPRAFVIAYSLGVVLTFITVLFSAYRAANINIVRAIRDIPEPQPLRGADRSPGALLRAALGVLWTLSWIVLVGLLVLAGAGLFFVGLATFGLGILAGLALAALFVGGALQVNRRGRSRRAMALYIAWWVMFTVVALWTWTLLRTRGWARRQRNPGGWALWMLGLGFLFMYFGYWVTGQPAFTTGGVTISLLAIAMLAVYFGMTSRLAFTLAAGALLWYWLLPLPFSLFTGMTMDNSDPVRGVLDLLHVPGVVESKDGNIEMFFVSGICITASATLLVIFNADAILGLVSTFGSVLGGMAPALRTAVAYPLAAKFRTGMTLAMFGLVVFSLVVMATLNSNFTQLFAGDQATAGFNVVVEANPDNRIPDLRQALATAPNGGFQLPADVRVGSLLVAARTGAGVREDAHGGDFKQLRVIGADPDFLNLARLPMSHRAVGYASDQAVIEALRNDPTVAVVDRNVLETGGFGGREGEDRFALSNPDAIKKGNWQPIAVTVRSPQSGQDLHLKIIGVLQPQVTGVLSQQLSGLYTQRAQVEQAFAGGDSDVFFLQNTTDASQKAETELADKIESTLLERGVQAKSIRGLIDDQASTSVAFQTLFQGFMGLGLIVGIAALGVIAMRTVVERRQQIGMLRAIGYTRRLVALSFFLESSFIALAGVGMGLVLGTALSYNLLTSPTFKNGTSIQFSIPWITILVIGVIAYGASALMTIIPARNASSVAVADALRYE